MREWIRFKWWCFKCWMQFDDAFYQEWCRLVKIAFPSDLDHRRYGEGSFMAKYVAEEIVSLRSQNEELRKRVSDLGAGATQHQSTKEQEHARNSF